MSLSKDKPNVVVYHNDLLPLSTTFIRTQVGALTSFNAGFVGLLPSHGRSLDLNLSFGPILLKRDHGLRSRTVRWIYKRTRYLGGRFYKRLRAHNPALIHAHFALDGVFALRVANELNIPLITTLHGFDVTVRGDVFAKSIKGRIYLRHRERLWGECSKFFCSCDYIKQRAEALGYPRDKLETLYSGHDFARFNIAPTVRNKNLILYVGRLIEKKGCSYLIRTAALVMKECPSLELVIIGEGPLSEELKTLAKELKVKCRFLGNLAQPTPGNPVFDWMSKARIFCMPSVTAQNGDTEGQPAVFVEVHALGLPAVSFQTAGIGEVVLHGETGLLVPEKDTVELAAALVHLLLDDRLWEKFSRREPQWVRERFDIQKLNSQLERAYWEVIRQPRSASDS
jgi:glycosyltransferase involved in cell wall biosynthesis